MENVFVLGVRRFDFTDKDNRRVEGVQVNYITDDVLDEPNQRGCTPFTVSAPMALWSDLQKVPGYYAVEFRQRPGLRGKPTLQVVNARFLSEKLTPSASPESV